jgi:hypothetical protein
MKAVGEKKPGRKSRLRRRLRAAANPLLQIASLVVNVVRLVHELCN